MKFSAIAAFNPSECISGKVMKIGRMTGQVFRQHLQPFGISNSQASLLFVLSKKEGLTQKQLCEFTKLEKSSVNRNLQRLLDQSLLTRDDFPVIRITAKGKALVERIIPAWENAMAEIRSYLGEDGELALNLIINKLKI